MKSQTHNNACCIVLADCNPVALIPAGGGGTVLGFPDEDETATLFPTIAEAESAIERTPQPERWGFRIINLVPSTTVLAAEPEIPDSAATFVSPSAAVVRRCPDSGGRSSS